MIQYYKFCSFKFLSFCSTVFLPCVNFKVMYYNEVLLKSSLFSANILVISNIKNQKNKTKQNLLTIHAHCRFFGSFTDGSLKCDWY